MRSSRPLHRRCLSVLRGFQKERFGSRSSTIDLDTFMCKKREELTGFFPELSFIKLLITGLAEYRGLTVFFARTVVTCIRKLEPNER